MIPSSFDESTHCLSRPSDMTEEQCVPLSVLNGLTPDGLPVIVSCWKLTQEEVAEFQRTGRIWLTVYGAGMPPVCLDAKKPF